jgi:hypothetical protein
MKQYVYYQNSTTVFMAFGGRQFALKQGDIITANSDGDYEFEGNVFLVGRQDLRNKFQRVYTIEEQNRYDRIYEQAMLSAMQGMIIKGWSVSESKTVAQNAIDFADAQVKELKDKEF